MKELETEAIAIRSLQPEDLEEVVAIDARTTGRARHEYFKVKLREVEDETGIRSSLAAEFEGMFVGFLLARVYYGEFGVMEPVAVLDTIGVHADFTRRGVGTALLRQLQTNLLGLGIRELRTEVDWSNQRLLAFLHRAGFAPGPRISLDLSLD